MTGWLLRRPNAGRLSLQVARRNGDVFFRSWKSDFLPPLLEPALYLGAIGIGLGLFIQHIEGRPYPVWFGPALLATMGMSSAFFECAYGSFVRMYWQKTYDAITATPVTIDEVIVGELLWGATKATINATVVLLVLFAFQLPQSPLIVLALPVVFVAGFTFSAIGLLTTSQAPNFDAFNFPLYLYVTPMFFLSGTFFPLSVFDGVPVAQFFAYTLPLTHTVILCRSLSFGHLGLTEWSSLVWLLVVGGLLSLYAINAMKRRLIK